MDAQKKMLRGLLTATPTAITIQQLAKDYRNTIGEPIPYQKLGYNSLEFFLRSIPDTLQVQGNGPFALVHPVVSEKSSHVMELVSRQRVDTKKSRNRMMPLMKRHVVSSTPRHFTAMPKTQSQKIFYPPTSNKPQSSAANSISNSTNHSSDYQVFNKSSSNSNDPKKPLADKDSYLNAVIEKPPVRYNIDKELKQVSKTLEQTNITKKFEAEKLRRIHSSTNLKPDYSLKSNSSSSFNSTTSGNTNYNLFEIPMDDDIDGVPVAVKNNLKRLIKEYPDGIWCTELLEAYRKMFKRELKYQNLGFPKLIDLCIRLKSVFHYVRPSTEDFKLYDRSKPLPDTAEKTFTVASYSSINSYSQDNSTCALPSLDWNHFKPYLPPNVFEPGNEIPRTFVSEDTKENDSLYIMVGEVYDLSKFWVYKDDGQLDKLMDEMQIFYMENDSEYKIPQDIIREGVYCVAIIMGEYHRALIVDTMSPQDDAIRVFFIDYGTMVKIKSELYFLHEQFSKLPAQTIRCRLASIYPPVQGAPWSQESSRVFRKLIQKRDLTAKISRINWKDQYLEVFLADVTDPNDVFYINNVLVEKGLAVFSDQEQQKSIIDSLSTPIVSLSHLFPTFVELEHGLAPSTLEMEIFDKCNTPINFCYPQYFNVDLSEEKAIIKHTEEFWEKNVLKGSRKLLPHNHNIDASKLKEKPLNMSVFGGLAEDFREFLRVDKESSERYEEQTVINEEENDISSLNKKIEMWKTQTVPELREDCLLSEDIMKDILNICTLNTATDSQINNDDFVERDYSLPASEEVSSQLKISENGDMESMYSTEDLEGSVTSFNHHPLEDILFSNGSLNGIESPESGENYFDVASNTDREEAQEIGDEAQEFGDEAQEFGDEAQEFGDEAQEFEDEAQEFGDEAQEIGKEAGSLGTNMILNPNNPFLQDIYRESKAPSEDIINNNGRLLSSNPFLSYIPESKEDDSDKNSNSTASTDYGTYVEEIKVQRTWSTIDHTESNNRQYSESLDFQAASNSAPCTELPYPTPNASFLATAGAHLPEPSHNPLKTNSVGVGNAPPGVRPEYYFCPPSVYYPPFYHPSYHQPYPYANPYANPYYLAQQQQINRQVYMRSSFNVRQKTEVSTPKAICPPPGFEPNSNVFKPQTSNPAQDFYESYNDMLREKYS